MGKTQKIGWALTKMKLRYKIVKDKKVYTLKQEGTKDAHYKFVRIKSISQK